MRLAIQPLLRAGLVLSIFHEDVIKWKHFPRYWSFVRRIHRVSGEFPAQRSMTRLSKQWQGWWFETLSRLLWRHCNVVRSSGTYTGAARRWTSIIATETSSSLGSENILKFSRADFDKVDLVMPTFLLADSNKTLYNKLFRIQVSINANVSKPGLHDGRLVSNESKSHLLLISKVTGDPLHSRAACTQLCNLNTHSRAYCSPGARLCEQWGHGCVNNEARLCARARLCRGSPVKAFWSCDESF